MFVGASFGEADDLAQEAMLAVFRRFPEIVAPEKYARATITRTLARERNKAKREQPTGLSLGEHGAAPIDVDGLAVVEETARVLKLLMTLPCVQRVTLALTIDGFTPEEIADLLGQKTSTARSNQRHARERLRQMIAAGEEESDGLQRE
jgi:RNA polymerase sigma factor (sigma-70 family)